MKNPFILAAQPNMPTQYNNNTMMTKERVFASKLGINFSGGCTCTGTNGECDDCD